jgi:hypothetical protein
MEQFMEKITENYIEFYDFQSLKKFTVLLHDAPFEKQASIFERLSNLAKEKANVTFWKKINIFFSSFTDVKNRPPYRRTEMFKTQMKRVISIDCHLSSDDTAELVDCCGEKIKTVPLPLPSEDCSDLPNTLRSQAHVLTLDLYKQGAAPITVKGKTTIRYIIETPLSKDNRVYNSQEDMFWAVCGISMRAIRNSECLDVSNEIGHMLDLARLRDFDTLRTFVFDSNVIITRSSEGNEIMHQYQSDVIDLK